MWSRKNIELENQRGIAFIVWMRYKLGQTTVGSPTVSSITEGISQFVFNSTDNRYTKRSHLEILDDICVLFDFDWV
jgi:hypothetical protein